jgi:hypothetical protein
MGSHSDQPSAKRKGTTMHLTSDYTLVLKVFSPAGKELLHTFAPSLERCAEDTWFSGICTGQLPPWCTAACTTMRPLWRQEGSNAPGVHGFVIDIDCQCTGCQHTLAKMSCWGASYPSHGRLPQGRRATSDPGRAYRFMHRHGGKLV